MTIKELDKKYELQKKLSTFLSNFDEQGRYINECTELNYILQCLTLCDLSECEYKILNKNIRKLIYLLRSKYDNIIEERREEEW